MDYLGIFDDVAKSLAFDETALDRVVTNIEELKQQMGPAMSSALSFFPGLDRAVGGYEGLIQAQAALEIQPTRMLLGWLTASSPNYGRRSVLTRS